MQLNLNDALPWVIGGAGLLVLYHVLTDNKETKPELAAAGNTRDFPDFPKFGSEPNPTLPLDDQDIWPHPYKHPKIPRYVGAGSYFQNTAPIYDPKYFQANRKWYDLQQPPLLVTVSQNQPTPETYSHHHFYFEQNGPEEAPIDNAIFKNLV